VGENVEKAGEGSSTGRTVRPRCSVWGNDAGTMLKRLLDLFLSMLKWQVSSPCDGLE